MSNSGQFQFGKSAFGSNANTGQSPFGSNANTGQSPFGSNANTSQSPFGSNKNTSTSGSGLFGNIGAPTGGGGKTLFGTASSLGAGQGGSLFGAGTSAAGGSQPLFGVPSQTPNKTTEASTSGQTSSIFGNVGKTNTLFGSNAAATPAPSGTGFSLASTTPAGPPPQGGTSGQKPGGLFQGLNTTTTSAAPSATAATTSTGPSLFGGISQPKPTGLFGGNPALGPASGLPASTSGGGLFSNVAKDKQTTAAPTTAAAEGAAKPLFPLAPQTGATSSLFKLGSAGADSAAKPAFPSLGGTAATAQPATPTTSATKPLFPNLTATTLATPSATPAAATSNVFNLGAPKSTAATTPGTTTTTAPAAGSSLFTKPAGTAPSTISGAATTAAKAKQTPAATTAPAASIATTAAGTTTAAATATGGAALGASTAGPAPPAQSRLKNKTMDEIITRWATDLTKYQKEFREQAEKVAEWDRVLVENGTKVQKLYGSTVDAERATQEVERQLASVEGQQEELSAWLDRYEREVDDMISKQVGPGETLQGPDQERERTYKLAENLSERLDEMGKDLTSMIEEVNSASATLSKTNKADEPISQIVRILNSHLTQLQNIDQGTTELQGKVVAAQKSGQALASRFGTRYASPGVGNGSVADAFYQSYMGRRR